MPELQVGTYGIMAKGNWPFKIIAIENHLVRTLWYDGGTVTLSLEDFNSPRHDFRFPRPGSQEHLFARVALQQAEKDFQ